MTWTTPKTWAADELVTATDFNTHLRDNLLALKNPPGAKVDVNEATDYTTTSTEFVDVDPTDLALTITPSGSEVLVHFHGSFRCSVATNFRLDIAVDGIRTAGDDGIVVFNTSSPVAVSFTRLISGLTPNTAHTFKLQWRTTANTAILYAAAGTSTFDVHPQFWVREIS